MQPQQATAVTSVGPGTLSAQALETALGQALALAEARTVLAVLLGNFSFELPEGVQREKFIEEEEVWWVTLQAKHGLPLKITPIMGKV